VEALEIHGLLSRCSVTVLGSAIECRGQIEPQILAGRCSFETGNLLDLPFEDKSFDVVTSFRFIPHCEQWQQHIRELSRVARKAVIVDYPTYLSVNCLSPVLFHLKRRIEKNTRTYTLFSHRQIAAAFEAANFVVTERCGEFIWPMVVHRIMGNPTLSALLEGPFAMSGVTKMFGSPVIVRATPKG
ncbi:MAG: methyltransferase domain-containing protein, partial [Proteobacteria bacterium]|nr:methyltransferase domain-containing protein [Pseudomonadota bacterium]